VSLTETKYRAVRISQGPNGWGGPLIIKPDSQRDKIVAVTGGGIPPIAHQIAQMTGGIAVDGFRRPPLESEMACVIVDCGGTARCGVYPRKRIPTINLTPVGQSGPLAQFITEDIYVSGVKDKNIEFADGSAAPTSAGAPSAGAAAAAAAAAATQPTVAPETGGGGFVNLIATIGRAMGRVVGIFFNAGRRTIDQVVRNVLPFMAFVTMLIGIILYTGIGDVIAKPMGPLANNIVGLLIISAICGLPFLSPILGPGAVIAQVIGVAIIGPQIQNGTISPAMSLPALFAYNTQVGCDFVPVGLALGEAKPKTIEIGVPAVLLSRQLMGPVSVVIAWIFSLVVM